MCSMVAGRIFLADAPWDSCFPLREDTEWRARHDDVAGPAAQEPLPAAERQGPLWDVHSKLAADGWKLDTDSYSTCFRVKDADKEKQQQLQAQLPRGTSSSLSLPPACAAAAHMCCNRHASWEHCFES